METNPDIYSCPSCNAEIKVYSDDSDFVACLNCGSAFTFTADGEHLQASYKNNTRYSSSTFIEVGMLAHINNVEYRVMARLKCIEKCFEITRRRGGIFYKPYDWRYEEYVLQNAIGEQIYLIYDEEGYWINYPVTPDFTAFPTINGVPSYMQLFKNAPQMQIEEYGNVTVDAFAGELDYDPRLGNQIFQYALYVQNNEDFVLEYNAHDNETEAFREIQLDEDTVINYFEGNKNTEKARQKHNFKKFASYVCLAGVLFSVLMILIGELSPKNVLLNQTFGMAKIDEDGFLTDSFLIDEPNAIYQLTLSADFDDSSRFNITAHILNAKEDIVNDIGGEFYKEHDEEDGGTASNNKATEKFRATEKGYYFVRVYAPDEPVKIAAATVSVIKGGFVKIYYLASGILFILLWYAYQERHIRVMLRQRLGPVLIVIVLVLLALFTDIY